jgi:hypothetical protein
VAETPFAGYGRLYAGLIPLCLAISFLPPFEEVTEDDFGGDYGSIWDMAGRPGGGPARFGVVLLLALIAFLVAAAFRPRTQAWPVGLAMSTAVIVPMLLLKPGTGTPEPGLTGTGMAAVVVALGTTTIAIAHLWHLALHRE